MGIIVPILPGTILIWLTILAYAILEGFTAIDWASFVFITLIALITGTADIWMSLLGSKKGGASIKSMLLGVVGAIAGFFLLGSLLPIIGSLIGGVLGYATGVLVGQYLIVKDWRLALKAIVGGIAGWGIATAVQLGGGIVMLLFFIWQVLKY